MDRPPMQLLACIHVTCVELFDCHVSIMSIKTTCAVDSYEVVAATVIAMASTVAIVSRNYYLGLCSAEQLDRYRSLWADRMRSSDDPPRDDISWLVWTADAV